MMNRIKFPFILKFVFFAILTWGLFSPNPVLTLVSILVLPFLIKMLWDKDIPPVLIAGIVFQWLSITLKVFYANIFGMEFTDQFIHRFPENIETAFYLSITGLISFSFGIYLSKNKNVNYTKENFTVTLKKYDSKKLLIFYLIFSLVLYLYANYAWLLPGFTQLLLQFKSFKWGLLFLTFSVCYLKRERLFIFFLILFTEIIVGFTTYFSSFKEFIILLAIFYLYYNPVEKLNLKKFSLAAAFTAVIISLSVIWTVAKQDYRYFLSGGIQEQVVTVSRTEALSEFINISASIDLELAGIGVLALVERLSYIDFFSAAIDYVPTHIPHTNGKLFFESFLHIITPRLLFPDKEALDDSEHLNKYTGLNVAGVREGASIGLGHKGDAYIDFGYFLFIPLFILGFLIGKIYYLILRKSYNIIWAFAFIIPMFYIVNLNEISMIKMVGAVFTYLVMWFVINKFFVKKFDGWIKI
jgi:hypothetical protein